MIVCDKVVCERSSHQRHQSQPSAVSTMPVTQSEGRCCQVPRLPSKVKVVCDKVVCDKVVCDKVVCDKVVRDKVVCDKVVP